MTQMKMMQRPASSSDKDSCDEARITVALYSEIEGAGITTLLMQSVTKTDSTDLRSPLKSKFSSSRPACHTKSTSRKGSNVLAI